jgi:hypothetical protein
MTPHPLEQALIDAGFPAGEAGILAGAFPAEPVAEFMAGLDQIAEAVGNQVKPSLVPSSAEPWRMIHGHMLANGKAPDDAYEEALSLWPNTVQFAIAAVVSLRLGDLLKAAGAATGGKRQRFKTADYISALHSLGYQFRINELDDALEVNGCPMSDALQSDIRARMRDIGFDFVNVMEDAYMAEGHHNRYHPIRDYLNGLQYDGGNHIHDLASHFTDKYGVIESWLRHWLIGAVAKAKAGRQNMVLILDGPQGIGKSLFARWLGGALSKYFSEATISLTDKDSYLRLINTWIWEIGEFGQTVRRLDRESLKNFITLNEVTVRAPYGRHDIKKPALASMIGTVNNEIGILDDPTGSRRFLTTHVEKIDWNYTKLDVHQVWAEAYAAFLAGEPWQLSPAEQTQANHINQQYEIEDPTEGLLLKYFRVDATNSSVWTSSQEILAVLENNGLKGTSKQNSMALAATMKRLGCDRAKRRNSQLQPVWGYIGVAPF